MWRRPIPLDLYGLLMCRPSTWVDDGLTSFPDSILGYDISPAGSGHDMYFCTRCWPAGRLTRDHKEEADRKLGQWVRALLPFGLRWVGWMVFLGVYTFSDRAFDTCGPKPRGATAGQMAAGLCRHGCPKPKWMTE
jgi:hypothetical protein